MRFKILKGKDNLDCPAIRIGKFYADVYKSGDLRAVFVNCCGRKAWLTWDGGRLVTVRWNIRWNWPWTWLKYVDWPSVYCRLMRRKWEINHVDPSAGTEYAQRQRCGWMEDWKI